MTKVPKKIYPKLQWLIDNDMRTLIDEGRLKRFCKKNDCQDLIEWITEHPLQFAIGIFDGFEMS